MEILEIGITVWEHEWSSEAERVVNAVCTLKRVQKKMFIPIDML